MTIRESCDVLDSFYAFQDEQRSRKEAKERAVALFDDERYDEAEEILSKLKLTERSFDLFKLEEAVRIIHEHAMGNSMA